MLSSSSVLNAIWLLTIFISLTDAFQIYTPSGNNVFHPGGRIVSTFGGTIGERVSPTVHLECHEPGREFDYNAGTASWIDQFISIELAGLNLPLGGGFQVVFYDSTGAKIGASAMFSILPDGQTSLPSSSSPPSSVAGATSVPPASTAPAPTSVPGTSTVTPTSSVPPASSSSVTPTSTSTFTSRVSSSSSISSSIRSSTGTTSAPLATFTSSGESLKAQLQGSLLVAVAGGLAALLEM